MSDFKLPDLPSDDELGITDEDRETLKEEPPELTPEERRSLGLGDETPKTSRPPGAKKQKRQKAPKPPKTPKAPKPPKPPRQTEPEGPRSPWRGPVMLVALVLAGWLSSAYRTLPSPVPANAPDTAFSSARAMSMDVEIARRAHPTGSPAHAEVRDYVIARLRELGLDPEVQTTTAAVGRAGRARFATVRNIVARVPGTASTGAILLLAHYDAAGIARGAGDDGAGVVAILEGLRALRAGPTLQNDVIVLITDAEELGLMGAQAFVDEHPWMADVSVVLNFEMRGGGGPSVMFETGSDNGWVVRAMKDAGVPAWANSMSYEVYKRLPNDTDFTRFREAGKQGLNFAAIGRASVYHQAYDQPSNLSEALLQHHGENLVGMTRALGSADLAQVDAPDVTYLTLPFVGLIVYPSSLVLPLTAWMLLVAALVLLAVLRSGGGWAGLVVGLVLGAVSGAATAGAGYALFGWLQHFHPEYGAVVGSAFHHEGWYVLTLVGAGLFLVTALFGLARRWFSGAALAWGALLIPLVGATWTSIEAPAAAMDLQWPVTAAYLAVGASLLGTGRRASLLSWVLVLVLSLPIVAFMEPLVELLWLGLSFAAALQLGALAAVALVLLLPALDRLREPNAWWAPVAALVFGGACLGLGIRASEPTAERPAPSALAWAYDRSTGQALWVTEGPDQPAYEPARAWVESHAGGPVTQARALDAFGYRSDPFVASAPAVEVPPLQAWFVADSTAGGVRHVRLALRSAIGAEMIQLRFPEQGTTRATAVNGRPIPVEGRASLIEHWGIPDPAVLVDLEMPEGATVDMDVVEHLLRGGEIVGAEHFERPPELAPDIIWASDRAMIRTPASALSPTYEAPEGLESITAPAEPTAAPARDTTVAPPDTTSASDTVGVVPSPPRGP